MSLHAHALVAFTASLLLAPTGALLADTTPKTQTTDRSVVVHFGDLDLSRPRDVAKLYRRLEIAADSTCGEREITGNHFVLPEYRQCYVVAVDRAVAELDRPMVTAYHQKHRIFERDAAIALVQR